MVAALEIIVSIEDNDGDVGTTTLKVPNGFSLAQYAEFGAAMSGIMDDFIGGRISGADLCFTADLSALNFNFLDGSADVEDLGAFQFRTGDGRPVRMNVPGLIEAVVPAGSDDINVADPLIAPLTAMMTDGLAVTGGTIQPCDVGEDDIVGLESARERFRASGSRG